MNRPQRNRRIKSYSLILVVLSVLPSACSPSSASSTSDMPAASKEARATTKSKTTHQNPSSDVSTDTQTSEASDTNAGTAPGEPQGPAIKKKTPIKPLPPELPGKMPVEVTATLSEVCVEPGTPVTMEIDTESEAAIGYQAVYAGNKGGSDPPFGEGYGGNDKGTASTEGRWQSSWVVRADAPPGPARVDVIVGYMGEFGYTGPHFAVADKNGRCPSKWIKSGPDEA